MKRGNNTNNTLQELKLIFFEMIKGKFDYDGCDPESTKEDVLEDIKQLETDLHFELNT